MLSSILKVKDLSCWVHLGCEEEERRELQEVLISLKFGFREAPPSEKTDNLQDALCYAELSEMIQSFLKGREFKLVEKLTRDVLQVVQVRYPQCLMQVGVCKVRPPVKNLKGGVSYACGDFFG